VFVLTSTRLLCEPELVVNKLNAHCIAPHKASHSAVAL